MQADMHYYGTYVMARAAGIPARDAQIVAYAAQFVDDSTQTDTEVHGDGGRLVGTATVHTLGQAVANSKIDPDEQRRVWVPFHFLPGGKGTALEERLLCVKDSDTANEMMDHHVAKAVDSRFGLELLGLSAHVYMDTFAHYGFSGIGSEFNLVKGDTCVPIDVENAEMERYIIGKKQSFMTRYAPFKVASWFSETVSAALGHGGVATFPDRPFLHWGVEFEKPRPENGRFADRDNPKDYMDACERTHGYFMSFAKKRYASTNPVTFNSIKDEVMAVVCFEGAKEDRSSMWLKMIKENKNVGFKPDEAKIQYNEADWADQITRFPSLESSEKAIDSNAYRFQQAASWHRHFVLKELLPAHKIAVY